MFAFFVQILERRLTMNKESMNLLIKNALMKELGNDFYIYIHKVHKNNVIKDGLIILKKGENLTPTICLEEYYSELKNGKEISIVVKEILKTYFCSKVKSPLFDINAFCDFKNVKNKLFVKIINKNLNKELLQTVPHSLFLDEFAITVHCLVDVKQDGNTSFAIHNNHLNIWDIDAKTLLSIAIQNTRTLFGVALESMEQVLSDMNCLEISPGNNPIPIWILTNNSKLNGAATILFDDILKNFAKNHGSFYVIFSSIHEALLILDNKDLDIEKLSQLNQEVNNSQVLKEEVLGTKAYYYDKKTGFIY